MQQSISKLRGCYRPICHHGHAVFRLFALPSHVGTASQFRVRLLQDLKSASQFADRRQLGVPRRRRRRRQSLYRLSMSGIRPTVQERAPRDPEDRRREYCLRHWSGPIRFRFDCRSWDTSSLSITCLRLGVLSPPGQSFTLMTASMNYDSATILEIHLKPRMHIVMVHANWNRLHAIPAIATIVHRNSHADVAHNSSPLGVSRRYSAGIAGFAKRGGRECETMDASATRDVRGNT